MFYETRWVAGKLQARRPDGLPMTPEDWRVARERAARDKDELAADVHATWLRLGLKPASVEKIRADLDRPQFEEGMQRILSGEARRSRAPPRLEDGALTEATVEVADQV